VNQPPETRASLLVRLKDRADQAAWYEFAEIYRPVIVRLAGRKGMQAADAEDLAQQVLAAVAKAIGRWQEEPRRARFRTWLHRVASNLIVNALTRGKPDRGSGDTGLLQLLDQQPANEGPDSDLLRLEWRREAFRWAATQIRDEFQPDNWEAFWRTAIEGEAVDDVAQRLGKSRASVHSARSRIMRRLREKVTELSDMGEEV
jgi:RNA polymerase sigma-70 factor (ECF subfamily)